jgi:hypothetical protein
VARRHEHGGERNRHRRSRVAAGKGGRGQLKPEHRLIAGMGESQLQPLRRDVRHSDDHRRRERLAAAADRKPHGTDRRQRDERRHRVAEVSDAARRRPERGVIVRQRPHSMQRRGIPARERADVISAYDHGRQSRQAGRGQDQEARDAPIHVRNGSEGRPHANRRSADSHTRHAGVTGLRRLAKPRSLPSA